jgi:hypothetical protein
MQYLVSVIDDQTGAATPTEMAAIDRSLPFHVISAIPRVEPSQ